MTTATDTITAEQLLDMAIDEPCELIAGKLYMMTPAGHWHGRIESKVLRLIGNFVEERDLGDVYGGDTGFVIARDPDTVLAPDVAFVRTERLPDTTEGYFPGAPDLAVEVVSPGDRAKAVSDKVRAWLEAGCLAVWVVRPDARTITVHRGGAEPRTLGETDTLDGGDVLPGFSCRVAQVFERP